MTRTLAAFAESDQAVFANQAIGAEHGLAENRRMVKKRSIPGHRMEHLRAWRDSLGLSRPAVANKMAALGIRSDATDQATIAKWESGETAVRVEDLELLSKIYGVSPDRLFFPPGDTRTPDLLKRAHEIIVGRDPDAVERWLASGEDMREPAGKKKDL